MGSDSIIKIEGMTKSYAVTKAVANVSLEIGKGEVRGLIGENGSGKSTLASMIAGSVKPDAGKMHFMGKPYSPATLLDARNKGVCILMQEQGTIDGMTVAENIFLGREGMFSRMGNINRRRMVRETKRILEELGMDGLDPESGVNTLTFEDRKLVEVAAAMYMEPKLLIVDETSTALSQAGRELIYSIIRRMKASGNAVVFISHDLSELASVCDALSILRDGMYVDTMNCENIDLDSVKRLMIGRELVGDYYRSDSQASHADEMALTVSNVACEGFVNDVAFSVHKGEIFGIGGLTECGMHELGKILFGAIKPDSGEVVVCKTGKTLTSPEVSVSENVAYIPKDRDQESAFQSASIMDNITLSSLDKIRGGRWIIRRKDELALAESNAAKMNVKMKGVWQMVKELSGGNKQKVVLAKWLANDSEILIMDCPTRGVDVGVKAAIYQLMNELKAQGKAIVMVSEELAELIGMSDRIMILKNGRSMGVFNRSDGLSKKTLIQMMI